MYCWSASYTTVLFPATSLNRDRPTARFIRHHGSSRPWRFCSTGPVGPICCVRHGRPRHFAAEVTDKLRHWWYCPRVVPVILDQPYAVSPSWYRPIDHCSANMWCSTGLSAWANLQLTWFHSSSSTACRRTSTLMTLRLMVHVVYLMSAPCCRRSPDV